MTISISALTTNESILYARTLTHHFQVHRIALAVTLHVRGDAGVVAGLVTRHRLQCQRGAAHDHARLGIVLYDLIL